MRVKTLEIRWHDSKPIYTCDFQRRHLHRQANGPAPAGSLGVTSTSPQSYRLATGGGDKYVRIWMIHANEPGQAPRVEYLSTLERHVGTVNVVRWSPNGELLASAGDDGMILIWSSTDKPQTSLGGRDPEEVKYDKEFWKVKMTLRCTSQEVYDLAWSPTSEYILSGSTDNTARIFSVSDGTCVREIADHSHYIQGVAWDPMNEYIATQSSDRSMHVYNISTRNNHLEVHALSRNSRMTVRHARTPSTHSMSRPPSVSRGRHHVRRSSISSETESAISEAVTPALPQMPTGSSLFGANDTPLTPATSNASGPSFAAGIREASANVFLPPKSVSRRSSFSGSNAPASPSLSQSHRSTYGRSPSPMPPLPAIRAPATPAAASWNSQRLYGDENASSFFRRLSFSPDGGLLLTPAGQFEDPAVVPSKLKTDGVKGTKDESSQESGKSGCVYVYGRASFGKSPIASLPGHKKTSVAVKFSPVLYELRQGVTGASTESSGPKKIELPARDVLETIELPVLSNPPVVVTPGGVLPSPALSAVDQPGPPVTPSKSSAQSTGSVFALPYRMMYTVLTQDTVLVYDTQQTSPICIMSKLHYDSFTDVAWSYDGQVMMMASSDGYCTVAVFDEEMPLHNLQQHDLQLKSIALGHQQTLYAVSPAVSTKELPGPSSQNFRSASIGAPSTSKGVKRAAEPPTPARTTIEDSGAESSTPSVTPGGTTVANVVGGEPTVRLDGAEPPKKKRRVELKHLGAAKD